MVRKLITEFQIENINYRICITYEDKKNEENADYSEVFDGLR